MPPRAWGRRAKQPCQTQRKVPKHSLEPRGPRWALRGATGGGGRGRRPAGDGAGSRTGGEPCACLPGASGRPADAEKRRAPAPRRGVEGVGRRGRASRDTALGARLAPPAPGPPLRKQNASRPVQAERLGRPRARGACGLRRETCALVTGTRAVGARS